MFRIECLVEDRHLPAVLQMLASFKAANVIPTPMNNVAVGVDGQLVERTGGNVWELLRAWMDKNNMTTINAEQVRQFQMEHGRAVSGYSNTLARAIEHRVLKKRKGLKAGYELLPMKTK